MEMRLTWKDGLATAIVAFVVAAAAAATQGWGWPLFGSYRMSTGLLALAGLVTCALAGAGAGVSSNEPPSFKGSLGGIAALLHIGVAVLLLVALVAPSSTVVVAMAADIVAIWLVGTVHHVVETPAGHPAAVA